MKKSRVIFTLTVLAGLLCACTQEKTVSVDIFYTADVEGFYNSRPEPRFENQVTGGYGILKSFLQKQNSDALIFDGGNWFGSSPAAALTQGSYATGLLRDMPYSAVSVSGNDFSFGWLALRGIIRELSYPVLVSNLKLENQIPWPMHDYQIFTRNGIKIGVFGLVSPEEIQYNKTRLAGFSVQDPVKSAAEMVALLQSKGVDFIILLSSLGESANAAPVDTLLAEEVSGINLLLSANKEREIAETDQINDTYIVYPGSKLDSVAHIRVSFDKNNQVKGIDFEDIPLLRDSWGEDEALALQANQLQQDAQQKLNIRVTQAPEAISTSLVRESVLGDLLTDCIYKWSKLDGAVLNSDSIRSALPQGVVTEYDLYKMYPYGDNITFLTMKGAAFIRALEASLSAKDNFPQIAGFHVTYNPSATAGHKIKQVTLNNGRIVRPQDTYRFAVTDHVLAGGFGHDYFIDSLEFKSTFVDVRQIMRACLVRQKMIVLPKTDRWQSASSL
ncbi:MAG: bifunctional metallophosphatase/5'-nucleotidase [Elusimicrobiaceae bacterium]|nr:bifunctional metallophosphatase/5'-nucleotidase [Elusimicrobiaceae bacterium]